MRYIGRMMTSKKKTTPMMITWFYCLIKKEGSAIPTLVDAAPSGLPYLRHFSFAYSLVKHSYALDIIMNLAAASGLSWFLSGWYNNASFL